MVKRQSKFRISYLEFDLLRAYPEVKHASFLRNGDFDLSDRGKKEHYQQALEIVGVSKGVRLKQCHKDRLIEIKKSSPFLEIYQDFDGMMTSEVGVSLVIRHADCQAAIFYDPKKKAIANVHCGWRGSVKNIYRKTIDMMRRLYQSHPKDLCVCISPSLGPEKAEYTHYREAFPKTFWTYQMKEEHFDFWAISLMQLKKEGVLEKNIEMARLCTYSHPKDFFSYRREGYVGLQATVVALNPSSPYNEGCR